MCGYKTKNNVEGIEFRSSGRFVPMYDILNSPDILTEEEYKEFKRMKASESSVLKIRKNLHDLRNDMQNFQNSFQSQISVLVDEIHSIKSGEFLNDFLERHIKRLKYVLFLAGLFVMIVLAILKSKGL